MVPAPCQAAAGPDGQRDDTVQISTQSFDNFPLEVKPDEPIWSGLTKFNSFLDAEFPTVQAALSVERVNHFARLYTWKGSNPDLQPVLLMAHTDVVPVPESTRSRWTHDPFSGHLDEDGWMWGRGVGERVVTHDAGLVFDLTSPAFSKLTARIR